MLNRSLHKNALKTFRTVQIVMGDRERDRSGVRVQADHVSTVHSINTGSTTSLVPGPATALLEVARWLLGEGLMHGELRDEIYCQVMKQLNSNPNTYVVVRGVELSLIGRPYYVAARARSRAGSCSVCCS